MPQSYNDSGAQIVQGISPEPVDDLEIPATLGGRVVTSIGVSAFDKCVSLRSVSMGNGVKTISTLAFYGCTHLESVRLSENLIAETMHFGLSGAIWSTL
ncbi:MAG: leucine-rich repeat protein [Kiritimatiellae bacterium]|nr:leucine-rich repeat protein [Kiritimatiellia bacterium]